LKNKKSSHSPTSKRDNSKSKISKKYAEEDDEYGEPEESSRGDYENSHMSGSNPKKGGLPVSYSGLPSVMSSHKKGA